MKGLSTQLDLLAKYNHSGPRYTSYPPATHFTETAQPSAFTTPATSFSPSPRPLSLYIHLPFCAHQCLYCACTNIITTDQSQSARYLDYLNREILLRKPAIDPNAEVVQIQLGGGTPTFLLPEEIEQLGDLLRNHFPISSHVEAGIEIDPRTLTPEIIQAIHNAGFNRASLGIQDTNPRVQKSIDRIQPLEMIAQSADALRNSGMESINFDLIYGLPHQTLETFEQNLAEIIALAPDRIAAYSYAHIPWIKPFQKANETHLPSPETKLRLLQLTIEKLTAAGYLYIGMDHFAKPTDPLAQALSSGTLQRNFQGYTTHKGTNLHAFGLSAISHANGHYAQNHKTLPEYYDALDAQRLPIFRGYTMSTEDRRHHTIIMQIMCSHSLDYARLSEAMQINFAEHFKTEIESLTDLEIDGLLRRAPDALHITPLGRLFIRNIAMRFDAYHQPAAPNRYSKTI